MFRKSLVLAAVRISKMQAITGNAPKAPAVPLSVSFHYSTPHELCKKNSRLMTREARRPRRGHREPGCRTRFHLEC